VHVAGVRVRREPLVARHAEAVAGDLIVFCYGTYFKEFWRDRLCYTPPFVMGAAPMALIDKSPTRALRDTYLREDRSAPVW
jgi:hypothetical protein